MAEKLFVFDTEMTQVADAIREKGKSIQQIRWPTEFVSSIQSLTELNFEIVGGTTQPSNPKENTIWVHTDIDITGWCFSSTTPSEPVNGTVWFKTMNSGIVEIDVLEENSIFLNITSCSIYYNGVWTFVYSSYYNNNVWTTVDPCLFIFKSGNGALLPYTEYEMSGDCSIYVTDSSINITCTSNNSTDFTYYTTNSIDVTEYKTLSFIATFGSYLVAKNYSGFGLTANKPINGTMSKQSWTVSQNFSNAVSNTQITYSVDISNLTGNYYFAIAGYGISLDVTEVRLDR